MVFIEFVIIDNFVITLLIADTTYRVLSMQRSILRMLIAAAIGTVGAVFFPFLNLSAILILPIRATLLVVLSLILFLKKGKMFFGGLIFLLLTFLFGGALFGLGLMIHGDVETALRVPVTNIPAGVIVGVVWLLYIITKKVLRKLKRVADAKDSISTVEIDILGKNIKCRAFMDTGNRLYDTKSDLPVIVLSKKASLQVLGDEGLFAFLRGDYKKICSESRLISYSGATGKTANLLILKPKEVRFFLGQTSHIYNDVLVGLSMTTFQDSVEYDVLLHPALVRTLKPNPA